MCSPRMTRWPHGGPPPSNARRRLHECSEGRLEPPQFHDALVRMRIAQAAWTELGPSADVREQAIRLVRVHDLRAGGALQLAAAIVVADFRPASLEFVTLDTRQAEAADKEGFRLIS